MTRQNSPKFVVFPTDLGWMAILGAGPKIERVVFGYPSRSALLHSFSDAQATGPEAADAWPALVARLQDYAAGGCVDFGDVELDLAHLTPFQLRVVRRCRAIGYGQTSSYGALAKASGSPGAARAVGNTMASNRFPLIVPCHRVVNSDGTIGNYSALDGVRMKARLLELEGTSRGPAGTFKAATRRRPALA